MKNVLHKRDKEKKKLDAKLTKNIQYIRSRCDSITWFVIYKLIQRNVKMMMLMMMMMMNCFCGMFDHWKAFTPYFQPGPLSEILTIANLRHAASRVWTCAESEFKLYWMKLCSWDNCYATATKKKTEKKIVDIHRKKLCDLTRIRSLPFQPEDIITNLSDYRLNTEEIDLLKNGLNFSTPPKFIKKQIRFANLTWSQNSWLKILKKMKFQPN